MGLKMKKLSLLFHFFFISAGKFSKCNVYIVVNQLIDIF